ncbi:MAG: T9SS type A sorting domain-containing protein [Bacteroidaceae bacterium]|nr:T9SS type A sorting domain-containing protein [Bacteroidaceae bacterium]
MKKCFLMIVAILGSMPCFAGSSLILNLADSTVIVCSLAKKPQMTFDDRSVTLSSLEGTVGQWDFADVESWSFSDIEDAVGEVKSEKTRILIEDGNLTLSGIDSDKVAVYDLSGRLVTPLLKTTGSSVSFSINGFSKGTYIVRVGVCSVKFTVQ